MHKNSKTYKAYQAIFDTEEGELVLKDLFQACNMGETVFSPDNPYITSFNEGKRAIFLYISNVLGLPIEVMARQYSESRGKRYMNSQLEG